MQRSKIDKEIPILQKKRTTVRGKFTTQLLFTENNGLKRAEWVGDSPLEKNWNQLQQKYPSLIRACSQKSLVKGRERLTLNA